jgi:hypothetical protein
MRSFRPFDARRRLTLERLGRRRPTWSEMRLVVLRSAGAIGLAAIIMAVVSSAALFGGGSAPDSAGADAESRALSPAPSAAPAASEAYVERVALAAEETAAGEPPAALVTIAEAAPDPEPVRLAAPAPDPQAPAVPRRVTVRTIDPSAFSPVPAPVAPVQADQVDAPLDLRPRPPPTSPSAEPPTTSAMPTKPVASNTGANAPPAGRKALEAALLAAAARAAAEQKPPLEAPSIWTEAADCPRDWVSAGAKAVAEGCGAAAHATEPPAPVQLTALEAAASEHAEKLAAMAPRIPQPRPDPPRRVRTARKWPAGPPPNCGEKHAYWRYVDERRTKAEWYCK